MSAHTPGPWHFVSGNQVRSTTHQIARVWMMRNGEGMHNARLIAAAPDLLAALRDLADDISDRFDMESPSTNPGIKSTVKEARAAIAKATGSNK